MFKCDGAVGGVTHQLVEHLLREGLHVDRAAAHFAAAQTREGQKVVDELPHLLGVLVDHVQHALSFLVELVGARVDQHAGESVDGAERRAQVV